MEPMEEPKVIFENADFVAVEKPAGLLVHRVRVSARSRSRRVDEGRRAEPTLADWVAARYPEVASVGDDPEFRPGIVHRLDKETSGVMVVARRQEAFAWLKAAFQSRAMRKTYAAFVYGVPSPREGTIDRPIGIKAGTLKRSIHATSMVKEAVTDYKVKEAFKPLRLSSSSLSSSSLLAPSFSLLEVTPRTGRTHQIRVHLASIGHPIVGDALYAPRSVRREKGPGGAPLRLMLHAEHLEFADPAGTRFSFGAPLPEDFLEVIHTVAAGGRGAI